MAIFRQKSNTIGRGNRTGFGFNINNKRQGVPMMFTKRPTPLARGSNMQSVPQFDIRPDRKIFLGTARMPLGTRTDEQGLPIAVGSERKKAIRRLLL